MLVDVNPLSAPLIIRIRVRMCFREMIRCKFWCADQRTHMWYSLIEKGFEIQYAGKIFRSNNV